jgi:putative membrane protein
MVPGISYDKGDWPALLMATLVLGILNTFLKPILVLLSLPLVIFTLGLFMIIINAFLLYFVGSIFKSFQVESFSVAILGAIVISIISWFLNMLAGTRNSRIVVRQSGGRQKPRNPNDPGNGGGPVIDV